MKDWKANTFYKGNYADSKENHKVCKWFWQEMEKLDQNQLRKMLKFVTGSQSVPVEGFSHLMGMSKQVAKFTIASISP